MRKYIKHSSDWKIEYRDGSFDLKVVGFPTPPGCEFESESMWVTVQPGQGNDYSGQGVLNNTPLAVTVAKFGDLIEYAGGTDDRKPVFVRTLKSVHMN